MTVGSSASAAARKKKTAGRKKSPATQRNNAARIQAIDEQVRNIHPQAYKQYIVGNRVNQELIRAKIAAENHHYSVVQCLDEIVKTAKELDDINKRGLRKNQIGVVMAKIAAIRIRMAGHFRLLSKYLPDAVPIAGLPDDPGDLAKKLAAAFQEMNRADKNNDSNFDSPTDVIEGRRADDEDDEEGDDDDDA